MSRESVHAEIRETLGQVPGFWELPDDTLDSEWDLFKRFVLSEGGAIPPKYRELIGIAVAAATHCWYCSNFHRGVAQLQGANEEEIQEAVHLAKFARGWSAYLNGLAYDREQFLRELQEVGEHLSSNR